MSYILQVHFPWPGPWGDEMTAAMEGLALSIAQEPGLIWKIWTGSEETQEAGGIYLFRDKLSAESYIKMHTQRLKAFGLTEMTHKIFSVNEALSRLDNAPL